MIAELGVHRAEHLAYLAGEHHLIKLFDHLAGGEFTQVATLFAGQAF